MGRRRGGDKSYYITQTFQSSETCPFRVSLTERERCWQLGWPYWPPYCLPQQQRRLLQVSISIRVHSECLSGTDTAEQGLPPASAFYVPKMPGLVPDPSRPLHIYAGHLPADPRTTIPAKEVSANLFFTLVKARRSADKERILFWFNGGPGCSSFDGLMMEVGPWRVDGKGGLKLTDGGWEEYTNIVFGSPFSARCSHIPAHLLFQSTNQRALVSHM